jgi:predicted dithiol-disulfide oxidoreductase (DUF899 family)
MQPHRIVSADDWTKARKALLAKEKELTHARDRLSAERRALPCVKVDKDYVFDTRDGKKTLSQLFAGRSQLLVYHFMLGPGWKEGCPSCSFLADHFDGANIHLSQRDVTFVAVSRAPLAEIEAFKTRMGWLFPWVSSFGSDFNFDYHVSLKDDEVGKHVEYNYERQEIDSDEMPGVSVFFKDESGTAFHTYSAYARGLDILLGTYNFLDLTPKGRDEDELAWSMAWVRHHDKYENAAPSHSCCSQAQPVK